MRQTFPPKDAAQYVVFSTASSLNITLDAASLISALSSLLKGANQDFVTFVVTMDLYFSEAFAFSTRENQFLWVLCLFLTGQTTLPWRRERKPSSTVVFIPLSTHWGNGRLELLLVTWGPPWHARGQPRAAPASPRGLQRSAGCGSPESTSATTVSFLASPSSPWLVISQAAPGSSIPWPCWG